MDENAWFYSKAGLMIGLSLAFVLWLRSWSRKARKERLAKGKKESAAAEKVAKIFGLIFFFPFSLLGGDEKDEDGRKEKKC